MSELMNEVVLDGTPKISQERRGDIKSVATKPTIVVCFPIGDKHESTVLKCPKDQGGCGAAWAVPGLRQPNLVPVQLMLSHMNLVQPLNVAMSYLAEAGRLSAEARQIMTKQALRMGTKYILYWDDDTLPPSLALYTLFNFMERNPHAGAVTGIYTTREEPNEPLVYTKHGAGAAWDIPLGPSAEPVPIFGAGAGFLLARAEAIEDVIARMAKANDGQELPIWADSRSIPADKADGRPGGRRAMWGHDVRFCKLLNDHDWPVYAHGQVLCGHLDIATGRIFEMPKDAPGFGRAKNINTAAYWDQLYGEEGVNTWRQYEEMFAKVAEHVDLHSNVAELGCGVGVLGSLLVGSRAVSYVGYDISPVAVEACKSRFLRAEVADLRNMDGADLGIVTCVVATEVMEHLDEDVFHKVMNMVNSSHASKFIFTVPDNCMGPKEVPEHTALFNEALVRERMARYTNWKLTIEKGDDAHLLCVMER